MTGRLAMNSDGGKEHVREFALWRFIAGLLGYCLARARSPKVVPLGSWKIAKSHCVLEDFGLRLARFRLSEEKMNYYMILLRIIHISGAVFWGGTTFMVAGFLTPTIEATAPESGKVMQHLAGKTRFSTIMSITATLVVISGLLMYWELSNGLNTSWITSGQGLGLTIGGLAGLIAAGIGLSVPARATKTMAAVAQEIEAQGGPPTADQMGAIQAAQARLKQGGQMTAVLLVIAVLGMATASYLAF